VPRWRSKKAENGRAEGEADGVEKNEKSRGGKKAIHKNNKTKGYERASREEADA
jgi:hypothetical protein